MPDMDEVDREMKARMWDEIKSDPPYKQNSSPRKRKTKRGKMKKTKGLAYWEKRFKNALKRKGVIHYHASFITPWRDQSVSEKIAILKEMVKFIGYMDKKHSKDFKDITNEVM